MACVPGSADIFFRPLPSRPILERGEVYPVLLLIDPDDSLMHPERSAVGGYNRPIAFRHLINERPVRGIAIEVHEAIALRGPEEVTVFKEIQVVVHVDPRGVSLGEHSLHVIAVAIAEV